MLDELRRAMRVENQDEMVVESMLAQSDDSVRSAFLDDVDFDVLGAENDPEVSKLVEGIPEYDEAAEVNKNLKKLTESLEETLISEANITRNSHLVNSPESQRQAISQVEAKLKNAEEKAREEHSKHGDSESYRELQRAIGYYKEDIAHLKSNPGVPMKRR